jgi:hypothetical protein
MKQITRLVFILWFLSACTPKNGIDPANEAQTQESILQAATDAATQSPTSVPTMTATPTLNPTSTSTAIPEVAGYPDVPMPAEELFQTALDPYLSVLRLKVEQVQIGYLQQLSADGSPFMLALDESTGVPLLAAHPLETGEWFWEMATPKIVGRLVGLTVGGSVSQGDQAYATQREQYLDFTASEFGVIIPAGAFYDDNLVKYDGAKVFSDLAAENGQIYRIQELFWSTPGIDFPESLVGASQDDVAAYMDKRIRLSLKHVVPGQTQIVLTNEPFWEYQGYMGWDGDAATPGFPLYDAYGEHWIAEAYVRLFTIAAQELNLTPGVDFSIVGVNMPGIEVASDYATYCAEQVKLIKAEIAERLNIPIEQVSFDIGLQFHIGRSDLRGSDVVPEEAVHQDKLIEDLQALSNQTGTRLHLTEVDAYGTDEAIAQMYFDVIQAAKKSGVVEDVTFWASLSFAPPDDPWQNRLILPGFGKSLPYYSVLKALVAP